jgi:hypothetical protein
MAEENTAVAEPEDDATVVHDEAAEEKAHDELVADVTKMLDKTEEKPDEGSEEDETQPAAETGEGAKEEPSKDEPEELSQELQTRAEGAGVSKELAQRLHQSGQLEETLAAFDRRMIEHVQANSKDDTKEEPKGEREEKPPPKDQDVPALDPDVYDEDLAKRDAYHQQRIDALEAQVAELVGDRERGFDNWFDGVLEEMGYDVADEEKCQKTYKAYHGLCEAHGVTPESRDKSIAERAHAATFPEEVFKKAQQQTVDRLRDAEGKFLSSPKSKGGPPPKDATDEEVHEQLVSNVTAYLKEKGVQMSGV